MDHDVDGDVARVTVRYEPDVELEERDWPDTYVFFLVETADGWRLLEPDDERIRPRDAPDASTDDAFLTRVHEQLEDLVHGVQGIRLRDEELDLAWDEDLVATWRGVEIARLDAEWVDPDGDLDPVTVADELHQHAIGDGFVDRMAEHRIRQAEAALSGEYGAAVRRRLEEKLLAPFDDPPPRADGFEGLAAGIRFSFETHRPEVRGSPQQDHGWPDLWIEVRGPVPGGSLVVESDFEAFEFAVRQGDEGRWMQTDGYVVEPLLKQLAFDAPDAGEDPSRGLVEAIDETGEALVRADDARAVEEALAGAVDGPVAVVPSGDGRVLVRRVEGPG